MTDFSIVIPAYKEDKNLEVLLPELNSTIEASGLSGEIVVVDTMQPMDDAKAVCARNNARYVNRSGGNSYGSAVRTGIAQAGGKWIVFMDADGSHSPSFIGQLLKERETADVVIASRYVESGGSENSFLLIAMSKLLNLTYAFVLGIPCKDVSNSFKLYQAEPLKKLTLTCENFDIVEEILYKLCRANKNIRIKELPYFFKARLFGKTKRNLFLFILTYLFTIIKLRLK